MNSEQQDILRHALGLGRGCREYRNHFVTGKGSTDYPHCDALVTAGLMTRFPPSQLTGGDECFVVTAAGRLAARSKTPNARLQRPARLYRAGALERQVRHLSDEDSNG